MKNKILIISGDPNSINSEILYKCWKSLSSSQKKRIYLISNYLLLQKQFRILKYPIKLIKVNNLHDKIITNKLKILDVKLQFKNPFKISNKSCVTFIKNSLNLAHQLASKKIVKGIINCPIDKKLLPKRQGVTEFLASKCKIKDNSEVMLIKNKNLSISPITTHLNIKDIVKKLSASVIIKKINTIDKWFKTTYKKKTKNCNPRS